MISAIWSGLATGRKLTELSLASVATCSCAHLSTNSQEMF